ncbi:hypothetical protein [Streptomyces sp. NPDC003710]
MHVGAGAIAFALVPRMRQEQGLPNNPVLMMPWVVGLFAFSLVPWASYSVVERHPHR